MNDILAYMLKFIEEKRFACNHISIQLMSSYYAGIY